MATSWSLVPTKELSPELRLAQAISEFKSSLGTKEKLDFEAQKARFDRGLPTTRDVYRLTAEIDRAAEKVSGGRVYGPRFMKFLQAVQKFAALGDVLVGGSQNLIACGVWTGVRFALMATTARASFVSKVSEIFMNIGQSAPRYEELAHLYNESKLLQLYLVEYFIVVVNLCHYILQCSQQTSIGQFVHSLSEAKLNGFQTQLCSRGQFIKDEIIAITMSLVKEESSKSDKFRNWYLGDSKNAKHRRKMRIRSKLMDRCSKYDHEPSWNQLRKAGTAHFFSILPKYQEWRASTSSRTLLWAGKIGSGKSVLLASIVSDLNADKALSNTLITYFFCQWDISESLQARTILGALARQVLSAYYIESDEKFSWEDLSHDNHQFTLDNLALVIRKAMPERHRLIFILDGIDECEEAESSELLEQLVSLQSSIKLVICASVSSHRGNSTSGHGLQALLDVHTLEIPENNPDISSFIDDALTQRIIAKELTTRDEALKLEIRQALLDGAQGMMLWVALQIEAICVEKTDSDVRKALADLPKTLSEAFERELQRCSIRNPTRYRDRIITILLGVVRPLTLDEFGEATSVEPANTTWDADKHVTDMRSLLKCCGKLVSVDEETSQVRVVHHAVRQYLVTNYLTSDGRSMSEFEVQSTLANIVITYLNYDIFERQLVIRAAEMSAKHVTTNVLAKAMKSPTAADLTLKLLQQKDVPDFDVVKALMKVKVESTTTEQPIFVFKSYAEEFYMKHAWTLIACLNSPIISLYLSIVRKLAASTWSFIEDARSQLNAIHVWDTRSKIQIDALWGSVRGRATIIALLQEEKQSRIFWSVRDLHQQTCLEWAALQPSSEIVVHLANLRAGRDAIYHPGILKAFEILLKAHRFDVAAYFFENFSGMDTACKVVLVGLVLSNNPVAVEWLLEKGVDTKEPIWSVYINVLQSISHSAAETLDKWEHNVGYPALLLAIDAGLEAMACLMIKRSPPTSWPKTLPQNSIHKDHLNRFLLNHGFATLTEPTFMPPELPETSSSRSQSFSVSEKPLLEPLPKPAHHQFMPRFSARTLFSHTVSVSNTDEISYSKDEVLEVADINNSKWWRVRNAKGEEGIALSDDLFLLDELDPTPQVVSAAEPETTIPDDSSVLDDDLKDITMTEGQITYRARAIDSHDTYFKESINFTTGDVLEVSGIDQGWWKAKNAQGETGMIPKTYLKLLDKPPSDMEYPIRKKATTDHEADPDESNELSLSKGEELFVSDGRGPWLLAKKDDGTCGVVPSGCLIYSNEHTVKR